MLHYPLSSGVQLQKNCQGANEDDCQRNLAGNLEIWPERVEVSGCVTGSDDGTVESVEIGGSSDDDDVSTDEPSLLSSEDVNGITNAALSRSVETFSEWLLISRVKNLSLVSMMR